MPVGSGAGLVRVPNVGNKYLVNSATATIAFSAASVDLKEAKNFTKWTFQLDPNDTTVDATIVVYGTVDTTELGGVINPGTNPTAEENWIQLGSWVVNGTGPFNPITYYFPLVAVCAAIPTWTSGTISVLASASP